MPDDDSSDELQLYYHETDSTQEFSQYQSEISNFGWYNDHDNSKMIARFDTNRSKKYVIYGRHAGGFHECKMKVSPTRIIHEPGWKENNPQMKKIMGTPENSGVMDHWSAGVLETK